MKKNRNKAAAIIEDLEAVLNSKEENNPINMDNKPPTVDNITSVGIIRNISR